MFSHDGTYTITIMAIYVWSFVILILLWGTVTAPRCYVCNSLTDPACGHAFMLKKTDSQYIERCATSCYRFMAQKDDNAVISRGCLPGIKTIPRCIYDEKHELYGVMCTCNTHFCNVTSAQRNSLITTTLCLLLSVLAKFWEKI